MKKVSTGTKNQHNTITWKRWKKKHQRERNWNSIQNISRGNKSASQPHLRRLSEKRWLNSQNSNRKKVLMFAISYYDWGHKSGNSIAINRTYLPFLDSGQLKCVFELSLQFYLAPVLVWTLVNIVNLKHFAMLGHGLSVKRSREKFWKLGYNISMNLEVRQ